MAELQAGAAGGSLPTVRRRLGVVGTLVWDTIVRRDGRGVPVQEWGGIGYALEALPVTLPQEWEVVPLLKLGRDLSEQGYRFLREIPRVAPERGVRVVPEPNHRVDLLYEGQVRKAERISGGVPPWSWTELAPLVEGCDALYLNFISGLELDLATAQALRVGFRGPIYADLHSLFLAIGQEGDRIPRPLPHWREWLRSFDVVQMNESEFGSLGGAGADPWQIAAEAVGAELKLIAVTLGERGAAYVAAPGFEPDPSSWPSTRGRLGVVGPTRSARVAAAGVVLDGDPTGCGDVWGATFFARLLAGDPLELAMATANRMAARNAAHRGARGLGIHLRGGVAVGSGMR